ncbi:DUF5691 domain-containing protein [Hymenobacter properus]|uniref:SWIM-type domain-containing protein n=1 Tax=Hymenobacter properus TaxID=2791026 RepID=A0A931BDF2_9BACT|nr:DUF5691 domain-containing protein [Hymenobacter properus]MBF9140541.1 hypothetical protein [Hymenobacter properus]MBR7719348.1 hypothetical protein [Microvirga sp. SRT04]
MISFTEAQAQALITDPGTLKRGQELLKPAKWANLGRTDTAAWGECAGSGSKPYLTGIDLTEPAFKCSCPSRVFPCKHGAGLLLLMARQPELLAGSTPPAWLEEWLSKRQQTQEKKAEKTTPVAKAPKAAAAAALLDKDDSADATAVLDGTTTPEAADEPAKPAGLNVDAKRMARMAAGAEDLAAWLEDLMRAGLATLDQQPAKFWESQAARLVDNQLPGLAAVVRELATLRHAHADWPARMLGRLGELYLLVRAFQNLPQLSPEARPEILQQVGVNLKKEDLLATAPPVADAWRILGQFRWEEDRLTARRTWLHGRHTGRTALVLEFSFGGQPFGTPFIPHGSYLGELAFYPGLLPLRAAPVQVKFDGTVPLGAVPAGQTISQLLYDYADAMARLPWLREWPATLSEVLPTPLPDGRWQLNHATETGTLPLRLTDEDFGWQLLAESGGQPLTLFGEWDGQAFRPLSSWLGVSPPGAFPFAAFTDKEERPVRESDFNPTDIRSKSGFLSPEAKELEDKAPTGAAVLPSAAQLLRIALLGTRQSGETVPAFPTPAASPEQQLLLAAGTLALMRKAGHRPATATTPALAPAPPELLPVVGPKGTAHLHQMLVNNLHLELLPDYLTRLAGRDLRVPPALLVPLLHHAVRSADTRAALGPVLGARGLWLSRQNPDWAKLADVAAPAASSPATTETWETGTLPQRRAWLAERFALAPDEARALLLAALPAEPAKAQEAFLEILAGHLHPDAEPALEALLKARGQDVRRLAAELLVQLPGAALTERLWARAAPLLTAKRKLLGLGKPELDVILPEAWDKSWLADGIEEKNARFLSPYGATFKTAVGPATARLANLLTLLPPRRWTAHLGLTPAELLAAALASEWALPLLSAWGQSTLLHRDSDFAAAFLSLWLNERPALEKAHGDRGIDWISLAAMLPDKARQELVLEPILERVRRQVPNWTQDLGLVPAPWPRAFSLAVVRAIASQLANTATLYQVNAPPYHLRQLAWLLPQTVAPSTSPADSAAIIQQAEVIPDLHQTFLPQLHEFTDTLRFQADLEGSLSE